MTPEELEIAKAACCVGTIWDEYEGTEDFDHMVKLRLNHLIELVRKSQPSLPSNLDDAAEEWCKRNNKGIALCGDGKSHYLADGIDAFKACAEWIHGQPDAKLDSSIVNEWTSRFSPEIRDGIKSTAYHFWNMANGVKD